MVQANGLVCFVAFSYPFLVSGTLEFDGSVFEVVSPTCATGFFDLTAFTVRSFFLSTCGLFSCLFLPNWGERFCFFFFVFKCVPSLSRFDRPFHPVLGC